MKKVNLACSCVLGLILNVCLVCSQLISSPCPGVFDYELEETGIYGKIVVKPSTPTTHLIVQANFTIAAQILYDYYGTLDQKNETYALKNYNSGEPVIYRVTFPLTQALPRVIGITVNDRSICHEPEDTLQPTGYLTIYSLQHTSFYKGGGQMFVPGPPHRPTKPSSQSNITPYKTTTKPSPVTQNSYYPNFEEKTQRPITRTQESQPPIEETDFADEPVLAESYAECGTRASILDVLPLIYGGGDYTRGDQPWLVAIYEKRGSNISFRCGGTLISNRHVITAAQCVEQDTAKDIYVKLGVHSLSDIDDEVVVTRNLIDAKIHEDYNQKSLKNDISILTLSKEVEFSPYIRPACLWDSNTDLQRIVGRTGIVAGWGEQSKGRGIADIPQLLRMPIVTTEMCRQSNVAFISITSNKTFCAGERNGEGPCAGDSGGGLYLLDDVKWTLRGIASLSLRDSNGYCNVNEYFVFTDIAQYLPWIYKVINHGG